MLSKNLENSLAAAVFGTVMAQRDILIKPKWRTNYAISIAQNALENTLTTINMGDPTPLTLEESKAFTTAYIDTVRNMPRKIPK